MRVENRTIVLRLNAGFQALGKSTVKDALIAMNSGIHTDAARAIAIDYEKVDGEWDFSRYTNLQVCSWDEWCKLPVREFDYSIRTSRMEIRVPTVIVAVNFNRTIFREMHPTKQAIRERDGNRCQYTGRLLKKNEGNVDHVIPRDRWKKEGRAGSPDTWENMVWSDKRLNSLKGNKLNEEMGIKLLRQPKAPKSIPLSASIKEIHHVDWLHFLGK